MGLYISFQDVAKRLVGKVSFTENELEQNKMSVSLANRLINEAEGEVELDLSLRYHTPFLYYDSKNKIEKPFSALPPRPTQEVVRTLCELKSVLRILEINFGSSGYISSDNYSKSSNDRYNSILKRAIEVATSGKYKYPPLPLLKLNYFNKNDDGYVGKVIHHTTSSSTRYGANQVNDPSISPNFNSWYFYGSNYDDIN